MFLDMVKIHTAAEMAGTTVSFRRRNIFPRGDRTAETVAAAVTLYSKPTPE